MVGLFSKVGCIDLVYSRLNSELVYENVYLTDRKNKKQKKKSECLPHISRRYTHFAGTRADKEALMVVRETGQRL